MAERKYQEGGEVIVEGPEAWGAIPAGRTVGEEAEDLGRATDLSFLPTDPSQAAGQAVELARTGELGGLEIVRSEFEDRTWQIFWRTAVQEEPPASIAEEFGITPNAVRLAKSRVLRRLRQEFNHARPIQQNDKAA